MARLSNQVSVGSIDSNWASGASSALADLSSVLLTQSEAEKERERRAAEQEESARRFDLSEGRASKLFDQQQQEYQTKLEQRDWVKGLGDNFDLYSLREDKAKRLGFDPSKSSPEEARRIIEATPLYKEEVTDILSSRYQNRFGSAIDTALLNPYTKDVRSIKAWQEQEDERAKLFQEQENEAARFELDKLRAGRWGSSSTGGSKGKSKGSNILGMNPVEVAKNYKGSDWTNAWGIGTSGKEDVHDAMMYIEDAVYAHNQKKGVDKISPEEMRVMQAFAIQRGTGGADLDDFTYDESEITKNAFKALELKRNGGFDNYGGGNASAVKDLSLRGVKPVNIRMRNLQEWEKLWKKGKEASNTKGKGAGGTKPPSRDIESNLGLRRGTTPSSPQNSRSESVGREVTSNVPSRSVNPARDTHGLKSGPVPQWTSPRDVLISPVPTSQIEAFLQEQDVQRAIQEKKKAADLAELRRYYSDLERKLKPLGSGVVQNHVGARDAAGGITNAMRDILLNIQNR